MHNDHSDSDRYGWLPDKYEIAREAAMMDCCQLYDDIIVQKNKVLGDMFNNPISKAVENILLKVLAKWSYEEAYHDNYRLYVA